MLQAVLNKAIQYTLTVAKQSILDTKTTDGSSRKDNKKPDSHRKPTDLLNTLVSSKEILYHYAFALPKLRFRPNKEVMFILA